MAFPQSLSVAFHPLKFPLQNFCRGRKAGELGEIKTLEAKEKTSKLASSSIYSQLNSHSSAGLKLGRVGERREQSHCYVTQRFIC